MFDAHFLDGPLVYSSVILMENELSDIVLPSVKRKLDHFPSVLKLKTS